MLPVKKIAVLRANALGDYIFATPALNALRETFPNAEIVYLGRILHKELLSNRPGPVDRVIVVPSYPGISAAEGTQPDAAELDRFFGEMQKEQFDIAIQIHGGGKNSNPFLLRLGAKKTVGLKTPDAAELDITVPYIIYFSEILRNLEVVSKIGARPKSIETSISVTEKDIEEANEILHNPDGKPLAFIQPGASDIRRQWPPENFARVCDFLVEQGMHVCISGAEFEKPIAEKIVALMMYKNEVQNICARISLSGLVGVISKADLVISNDTGPLHVAYALKKPAVGIYWVGNMINGTPVTAGLAQPLLSWTLNCPLCGLSTTEFDSIRSTCDHKTSFVAEVTIEQVIKAATELIGWYVEGLKQVV
jgi:ADP-heptose:LPS heptosyltransferase